MQQWKNTYGDEWYDELVQSTIDIVSQVTSDYLYTDWGDDVGTIQIVLSQIVMWHNWTGIEAYKPDAFYNFAYDDSETSCDNSQLDLFDQERSGDSDYCEVDYADYLAKFHKWRVFEAPDHDNAQLFSYYDFYGTVVDYATIPGMCITWSSGGINQCTYGTDSNAAIVSRM